MAKKVYAVRTGRTPGIYDTWDKCKAMVHGYPGAEFKSFATLDEAKRYMSGNMTVKTEDITLRYTQDAQITVTEDDAQTAIAYVDGSFSKEQKRYAYGCVIDYAGQRQEFCGAGNDEAYLSMNNVAGEILGSMQAIRWAIEHQVKRIHIFYDYAGIEKWATGEWKANKIGTQEYQAFIAKSRTQIEIVFTKVMAHTGVELNERADQLAKQALGI